MNETYNEDTQSGQATPYRRKMLAGLGAAICGAAVIAAGGGQGAGNPDAALIAACDEFAALENTMVSWFPGGAAPIMDDNARIAARAPLEARQEELVDIIFDTPGFTLAAHAARARAALAYDPELIDGINQHEGHCMVIIAAMLRDLISP
jgi:hypothetical protein